jgi:predicted DNA-binding transcriptional regulator AlpA
MDAKTIPILFPYDPKQYLEDIRIIIREEIQNLYNPVSDSAAFETGGLNYKPLYKINELCSLFQITKPTIYDWIKHGKLKPLKIRSRVFFLWNDIQRLIEGNDQH